MIRKLGRERMVMIDGAGHALFTKPGCAAVFDTAKQVTRDYREIAGDIPYADEDVLSIVMTMLDLRPAPYGDFFSRHLSARPGTIRMDASRGECEFISNDTGEPFAPCMMHFAANEAPVAYSRQLIKLFRRFGVPTQDLLVQALKDLFETKVRWRLGAAARRLRRAVGA